MKYYNPILNKHGERIYLALAALVIEIMIAWLMGVFT